MSFKDIKGQDRAVLLLKEMLKKNRIPPALLFWGEEGVGKKMAAIYFAKAVNCSANTDEPCQACSSCIKINNHNHPDIFILPREDSLSIKIEEIRELQKNASLKNFEGRKKVFIIDEAHNLTAEAANAFLKVLEEPPGGTLFILVSSKPELLFSTIVSRCQRLRFQSMDKNELEGILKDDYGFDRQTSHYLAYFYQGRLGASLRAKDKEVLKEKNAVIDCFINGPAYRPQEAEQDKQEIKESLEVLLAWLRDIYLVKTGFSHSGLINSDLLTDILKVMPRMSFDDLDSALNFLSEASFYLGQNANPKLILANLRYKLWTKLHR